MKRIVSLVLCVALALGSVTYKPPKADAVALELTAALVGKVVGVTLISCGMAWAVDQISENMTGQSFGENVAREIQNWLDEEHNCEVIDVFFGGMMPNTSPDPSPTGNVVLTASAAFIAAVSAFGKWLYDKFALSENESAVVSGGERYAFLDDGSLFSITVWSGVSDTVPDTLGTVCSSGQTITFSTGSYLTVTDTGYASGKFMLPPSTNIVYSASLKSVIYSFIFWDGSKYRIGFYKNSTEPYYTSYVDDLTPYFEFTSDASLSVSAPNGLNLPDTDALPEGQGYVLELPETNGAPIQDLNDLMDLVVPIAVNNPEYVPTLNPAEITNPDPTPNPDGEEVPEPAPAGATIIDYLVDIWRKIKALPETIGNAVKSAFEPDPELVTEITTTFTDKFGWLETIHRFGNDLFGMTADTAPPVIYIHLEDAEGKYTYGGMEKALDLSWYQRYKADVDRILSGFMWLAFLWLVFKRASAIIQGGEMITEYTNDLDQGHR